MDRTETAPRESLPTSAVVALVMAGLGLALFVPIPVASADGPFSTHIQADDDTFSATVKRSGYRLDLDAEGEFAFAADERDLASLASGGRFELIEKERGVKRRYLVTADRAGTLTRQYQVDGVDASLDADAQAWRAAAIIRALRTTGIDGEARAGRFLARGPDALIDETALIEGDHVRSIYLGVALSAPALDATQFGRALTLARAMGSDFELRGTLQRALESPGLDPARVTALVEAASGIESDFERASLLVDAAPRLAEDDAGHKAWRTAVTGIGSDYEARRAIEAVFESAPAGYRADAIDAAARGIGSDFELRVALEAGATAIGDDEALIARYLEATARIGSDFERRAALTTIAPRVRAGTPSAERYRELARELGDHERGLALEALLEGSRT